MALKLRGKFSKLGATLKGASATAPSVPTFTGTLLHTLINPNAYSTTAGDHFGFSVAISSDRAIVGARFEDDAGGTSSGAAYIFDVTTGNLLHTLTNPNAYGTSADDNFGSSVAISGNTAIVGAPSEDDAGGTGSGAAYIFDATTGNLLHTLTNPNAYGTSASDEFGYSVAISDSHAIVGAYLEDDTNGSNSGAAYIYDVTTGNLLHTLLNPNNSVYGTVNNYFGFSVSISENHAAVGAYATDSSAVGGKAYIYDVTTGNLQHTLTNPNTYGTPGADYFGYGVAISSNYIIVSAQREDNAGGTDSGAAYIYDVTTGNLIHTLTNPTSSNSDYFGSAVSISSHYAIVGAYADDADGTDSGAAYIFDVTTGNLIHTLTNPNAYGTNASDYFGWSVAISDTHAVVGARLEDDAGGTSSGAAYIYN